METSKLALVNTTLPATVPAEFIDPAYSLRYPPKAWSITLSPDLVNAKLMTQPTLHSLALINSSPPSIVKAKLIDPVYYTHYSTLSNYS